MELCDILSDEHKEIITNINNNIPVVICSSASIVYDLVSPSFIKELDLHISEIEDIREFMGCIHNSSNTPLCIRFDTIYNVLIMLEKEHTRRKNIVRYFN